MDERQILEDKIKLEPTATNLVAYANLLIQSYDQKKLSNLIVKYGLWNPNKIVDYAVNETYFRSLPTAMSEPKYMLVLLWSRVLEERLSGWDIGSHKNLYIYLDVMGADGVEGNPLVLTIFFEAWFESFSRLSHSEIYKGNRELAEALNTMPQVRGAGKWIAPQANDQNQDFVIAEYPLDDEILFDLFTKSS